MWLLAAIKNGNMFAHSWHSEESEARAWKRCLEYDEVACHVCEVSDELLDSLDAEQSSAANRQGGA